jgi:hypothetical protein
MHQKGKESNCAVLFLCNINAKAQMLRILTNYGLKRMPRALIHLRCFTFSVNFTRNRENSGDKY